MIFIKEYSELCLLRVSVVNISLFLSLVAASLQ
jgi:hypothetical protein